MTMQDQDFWRRMEGAAGGLFDMGLGLYGRNSANREAAGRLREAQGPNYDAAMAGAGAALSRANVDPNIAARENFDTQRGLLSGADAKSEADFFRLLQSKGLLGAANYNPGVGGIEPSNVAMNPHMAAFYAARNARDAKMSADSMEAGERGIDRQVNRAGMLQQQAANRQATGITAAKTQPSRAASNMNMVRGGMDILRQTGLTKDIGGMIRGGMDWLTNSHSNPWFDTSASGWGDEWYG